MGTQEKTKASRGHMYVFERLGEVFGLSGCRTTNEVVDSGKMVVVKEDAPRSRLRNRKSSSIAGYDNADRGALLLLLHALQVATGCRWLERGSNLFRAERPASRSPDSTPLPDELPESLQIETRALVLRDTSRQPLDRRSPGRGESRRSEPYCSCPIEAALRRYANGSW